MLIDLHTHTSGISTCCKIDAFNMLRVAKEHGIDGVVLTNHYQKSYINEETPAQFAKRFLAEYHATRAFGKQMGVRVFFGIEVTMEAHDRVHMLVYGTDEEFVLRYPTMFDATQAQLYRMAHENGGMLVQAHPLRNGKNVLLNPTLLDGVEVNSHPKYDATHFDKLAAFARQHGLILTSGGDFHNDTHRPHCGVYLPDSLTDTHAIMHYLKNANTVRICLQEPQEHIRREAVFTK